MSSIHVQESAAPKCHYFSPIELFTGPLTAETPQIIVEDVQKSLGVAGPGSASNAELQRLQLIEELNTHPGVVIRLDLCEQEDQEELNKLARVLNPNGWKGTWTWHKLRNVLTFLQHAVSWTSLEVNDTVDASESNSSKRNASTNDVLTSRRNRERNMQRAAENTLAAVSPNRVVTQPSASSAAAASAAYEFEPFTFQRIGFPSPSQLYSIPRWILYRICLNNRVSLRADTTERQLLRSCELLSLEPEQLAVIARSILVESLSNDLVRFIVDNQHSQTVNHTTTNFEEIVYAQSQLGTLSFLNARVFPESDAEAIVLAATMMHKDITSSRCPRVDYAYLKVGLLPKDRTLRRLLLEEPETIDMRVQFNPRLPEQLYDPQALVRMCRDEGYSESEIIREGSYVLLQQACLLDTFDRMQRFLPSGDPIVLRNRQYFLISLEPFESVPTGSMLLFGAKNDPSRIAVSMDELASSFLSNMSFTNPYLRVEEPFSSLAIAKLRRICSTIIRQHFEQQHAAEEFARRTRQTANTRSRSQPATTSRRTAQPAPLRINFDSPSFTTILSSVGMIGPSGPGPSVLPASSESARPTTINVPPAAPTNSARIVTRSVTRAMESGTFLFIELEQDRHDGADHQDEGDEGDEGNNEEEDENEQHEQQDANEEEDEEDNTEQQQDEQSDMTIEGEETESNQEVEEDFGDSAQRSVPPLVRIAQRLTMAIDCVETTNNNQFASLHGFVRRHCASEAGKQMCVRLNQSFLRLAMTMRGWDGVSEERFPVARTPLIQQNMVDLRVTQSWAQFEEIVREAGTLGQDFLDLPLIRWRGEFVVSRQRYEGRTIRERLEIIRRNSAQESCIRLSSNWLCATSHRISTALGLLPPFSIELLRDIA